MTAEDCIELIQCPSLPQSRHKGLETYERPGSLAFEALLSRIDCNLAITDAEIADIRSKLHDVDSHLLREVGSVDTLHTIARSRGAGLVRSWTLTSCATNDLLAESKHFLSRLQSFALRCDGISTSLFHDGDEAVRFPALERVEYESCGFVGSGDSVLREAGILSGVASIYGVMERDLVDETIRPNRVSCFATPTLVERLSETLAGSLSELTIYCTDSNSDAVTDALVGSERLLEGLKSLCIGFNADDSAIQKLVSSDSLLNLESLTIRSEFVTATVVESIRRAAFAPSLRQLDLSSVELGSDGWDKLATLQCPSLHELRLRDTSGGSRVGCDFSNFPALRSLDISENQLNKQALQSILSVGHKSLEELNVEQTYVSDIAGGIFNRRVEFPKLKSLYLDTVNAESAKMILDEWEFPCLENLAVGLPGDSPGICIANSFAGLKSLSLSGVSDSFMRSISGTEIMPKGLRKLAIRGTLTSSGLKVMVASGALAKLWKLSLSSCPIGDEGARLLASPEALQELVDLEMVLCNLTENGACALASANFAKGLRWLSMDKHLLKPWVTSSVTSDLLKSRLRRLANRL